MPGSRSHGLSVIAVALLLLAGCGDVGDRPAAPEADHTPGLTDPVAVVDALAEAWSTMDPDALAALLAPDFEFCARPGTVLPALPGDCWDRAAELGLAANMFDPAYAGAEPPVLGIEIALNVLAVSESTSGTHEVAADAIVTVLTGPADGWSSDTRLVVTVARQPDGFLRVRKIQELSKLAPRADTPGSLQATSWGELKALYI